MTKDIFPQWVLVNRQIQRVSAFSNLPPALRPVAKCPLCLNPVIMKLGHERVHHYAHQPDIVCAATHWETALHLNTKYYIYEQLLLGTQLYLEQQCSGCYGKGKSVSWVKNWHKVELEYSFDLFRSDIAVIGTSGTINAIEVIVTHHVEEDKEDFYKLQGVPWLEVNACESIYEGENPWTIDQPLPYSFCKPPLTSWTCDYCRTQLRIDEEIKRKAEYRQHNHNEIIFAKLVDYYYPSGKKYRETYYIMKVVRNDKPVGVLVETAKWGVLLQKFGDISNTLLEASRQSVKLEIDRKRISGVIIDERKWVPWTSGNKFVARDIDRNPFLYEWDGTKRKWVKQEQQSLDSSDSSPNTKFSRPADTVDIPDVPPQAGVCLHCGLTTTNWWWFDGATRECKCRKCRQKGKY